MKPYSFCSTRLGFRPWSDADKPAFAAMNADPAVMEYFPNLLSREESDASVERFNMHQEEHGFCFFAVDRLDKGSFIGFIGLSRPGFQAHFTPCVEIGWRLMRSEWGQGFATEGAKRCLEYGFEKLQLPEIYSFTAVSNVRSEKVMQKIGMQKIGEFDHPVLEKGHALERHVLYCSKPLPLPSGNPPP